MQCPGPWFTSDANPRVVINLFHPSGFGKYGSQQPLLLHGGYPVCTCYDSLQAFQLSKFPEFIRILELIVKNEEVLAAIKIADNEIGEIAVQTWNNFGTEDHTPRQYKMLNHPKVVPINPQIYKQFTEEMEHYRLDRTSAIFKRFWAEHPWKANRGRWI